MRAAERNGQIVTEVFLVDEARLPTLYTYHLDVSGRSPKEVGGRLAVRAARRFGGRWAWSEGFLISDVSCAVADWSAFLSELWSHSRELFGCVRGVAPTQATVTARMKADFVAQGVFRTLDRQIERALSQYNASLDGKVQVLRRPTYAGGL